MRLQGEGAGAGLPGRRPNPEDVSGSSSQSRTMSYLFREGQSLESHPSHPSQIGSLGRPPFSIPLPRGLSPSPLASSWPQSPVSALPSPCLLGESPGSLAPRCPRTGPPVLS